jgi:DNA primase
MTVPSGFLDELRTRLPVSEVIGRHIRVIRTGREHKALCPFHHEKTPSFTINDDKGFFHCFGCGAHGDIVGFTMRYQHLSFIEALENLAGQAAMQLPKLDPRERQRAEQEKVKRAILSVAQSWFQARLKAPEGRAAYEYLLRRGLSEDTIEAFGLGFAPRDSNALLPVLRAEGHDEAAALEVGLLREGKDGRPAYPFFRDRVMFPVTDRRGQVIAFGGRLMEGEGPKYINSPEHALFQKGRVLFNEARARAAKDQAEPVLVVEGYMDVIALAQAGFTRAVAPLGTALTETQIESLWKLQGETETSPILCFDGDSAGQRAALRALDRALPLLKPGKSLRFAFLPKGEDPDSLVKTGGPAAMQAVLQAARPLADILWETEATQRALDSPESRAALEAAMKKQIGRIADRTVQSFYFKDMNDRIRAAFTRPWVPGRGKGKPLGGTIPNPPKRPPSPQGARIRRETVLLATLVNHPWVIDGREEALAELPLLRAEHVRLRTAILGFMAENPGVDSGLLRPHLVETGFSEALDRLLNPEIYGDGAFAQPGADPASVEHGLVEVMELFRHETLDSEFAEVRQLMAAHPPTPGESHDEVMARVRTLISEKTSLDE